MVDKNILQNPIWHSPAWITAIVGLISAFLTIPDVAISYIEKQKAVDMAQKTIEEKAIDNADKTLENHYKNLHTVLIKKPEDRQMTMRFIARTVDNQRIREWAESELELMEN